MAAFRQRASRALRAARSVADQRGLDPHDVETIILRLAKGWICQPKSGAGGAGEGRDAGVFVGGGGVRGSEGRESVFLKDAREVRDSYRCIICAIGFGFILFLLCCVVVFCVLFCFLFFVLCLSVFALCAYSSFLDLYFFCVCQNALPFPPAPRFFSCMSKCFVCPGVDAWPQIINIHI